MLAPAVFLDRDGTIIEDRSYVSRADDVRLLPGAAQAIANLNAAQVPVIVVTNQSGIGRGMFTEREYKRVNARMTELLAVAAAHVDATYVCPHDPAFACECRKPGTLLFRRAAEEHAIDLARSRFIGDRWRDVVPALSFGARGILVPSASTPPEDLAAAREAGIRIASTLEEAVE